MTGGPHLLIETSGRGGFVGLVCDRTVIRSAMLDESRRHARDLAEKVRQLFDLEKLKPSSTKNVIVSLGPGSYTGLRVGLASAKAFAYAIGCPLAAVPTFDAIANRTPEGIDRIDVIADGLQGFVYIQSFQRGFDWQPSSELRIARARDCWIAGLTPGGTVTGPGVAVHNAVIPLFVQRVPLELRSPTPESLWQASTKLEPMSRGELFHLEPLYLRGSSAEEKQKAQSVSAAIASARVS
jgi:tRNA threonylcarbamoyladenosine biosynthesis protein TsaB